MSRDPRAELIRVVDELYAQQLVTATGGNVSVRAPEGDALWITPAGVFKGALRPEDLARIDLEGRALDPGGPTPSTEALMHCAAYRARPETGAVVHAHAPHATILANTGLPFLPVNSEAAFFDELPRLPFTMPGTRELADLVGAALREGPALLMVNHGVLVGGPSLRKAADRLEVIERACEIILGCYSLGKKPPTLPDAAVAEIRRKGDLIA